MTDLFEIDYVIYDREKDHVICFSSNSDIVIYGCKIEAEIDRKGTEEVIKCTELPNHQRKRLIKQIKNNLKL